MATFIETVETEVHNVFETIVKDVSYAETIIDNVLVNDIPIAETVAEIVYPPATDLLKILALIGGSLIAISNNSKATAALVANIITPGVNVTAEQAAEIAESAMKTAQATEASITEIEAQLKKGLSYIPKTA